MIRSSDDFPLPDCLSSDIDLLFVSDAAVGEEDLSEERIDGTYQRDSDEISEDRRYLPTQPDEAHKVRPIYREQMHFFSRLIDTFTSPAETNLTRLRVALVASVGAASSEPLSRQVVEKFSFNQFSDKALAKRVIEEDCIAPVITTSPLSAARHAIAIFENRALGVRQSSEHVAIMAVGSFINLDMNDSDLELFSKTGVKIMFVLIDDLFLPAMKSIFPKNIVLGVNPVDSEIWSQNIPMALCSTCNSDWLAFRSTKMAGEHEGTASCYRLYTEEGRINWLDAHRACEKSRTHLVSIETTEELNSLRQIIPSKICSILQSHDYATDSKDVGKYVDVLIGLRRETGGFKKNFRWQSRPPLVYSHWAQGEPAGGYGKACAVWRFHMLREFFSRSKFNFPVGDHLKLNETILQAGEHGHYNLSEFELVNGGECLMRRDAWYTVPCGHTVGRMFLCEQPLNMFDRTTQMSITQRPTWDSIYSAISRGELGLLGDSDESASLAAVAELHSDEFEQQYSENRVILKNHSFHARLPIDALVLFECDDQQQIPYTFVCDRKADCQNKLDETICTYPHCSDVKNKNHLCNTGHCISREQVCDLFPDCPDKSDELECLSCTQGLCPDGSCLPKHWFADGEVDCGANTFSSVAEEMASIGDSRIQDCVVICNGTKCVSQDKMGDGVIDCQGPEGPIDETIGRLEHTSCYSNSNDVYTNWAPKCVYVKDRFGAVIGCKNMAHLQNCQNFTCPEGYIKCPSSYCVPVHYVNNREKDCPFGEDEHEKTLDCSGYFRCAGSNVCLHPDHVCDNHPDCSQKDDELGCHVTCRCGFLCVAGIVIPEGYNKSEPLTEVAFIDEQTRYLDLAGIDLSSVFSQFLTGKFENLVIVNLSNCRIQSVEISRKLNVIGASLYYLDLSNNLITEVTSTSWFGVMGNLRTLNLSRNVYLERIDDAAFNTTCQTSHLKELDLSYTSITTLSHSNFVSLKRLLNLNLRGTRIKELRSEMFPKGSFLQVLDLRDIPLQDIQGEIFKNLTILSALRTDTFKLCCPQIHNSGTKVGTCHAPKDAFSSCSDLMYESVLRLILWTNGIIAIIGNCTVIVYRIFYDQTILHMAYGHFVTHLAIADFIMGMYLLTIAIADVYFRGTYAWHETSWRNSIICKLAGFSSTLAAEASALFIFLITVDRFLVVKFPLGQLRMSTRTMKLCCALTWCLGTGLALIPLLPFFEHWKTYTSNGMCLGLPLMTTRQAGWQYSLSVFIIFDFTLFSLICLGQVTIYRTMTKVCMDKGLHNLHYSSRKVHDFTVARNLSLIAITDFICWFPICVTGLLALTGHDIGIETYPWMAVLVLPINSAINPLIYTIPALKRRWNERKEMPHSKTPGGNLKK